MRWIQRLVGSERSGRDAPGGVLAPEEAEKIGTAEDLLVGYEAALERNTEAARAEGRGDVEAAIRSTKGASPKSSSAPTPTSASPPSTRVEGVTRKPSASPTST